MGFAEPCRAADVEAILTIHPARGWDFPVRCRMKRQRIWLAIGVLGLVLPERAMAQADQYELGRRLGSFELVWEKQTDAQPRRKALAVLQPMMLQMILGQ